MKAETFPTLSVAVGQPRPAVTNACRLLSYLYWVHVTIACCAIGSLYSFTHEGSSADSFMDELCLQRSCASFAQLFSGAA